MTNRLRKMERQRRRNYRYKWVLCPSCNGTQMLTEEFGNGPCTCAGGQIQMMVVRWCCGDFLTQTQTRLRYVK